MIKWIIKLFFPEELKRIVIYIYIFSFIGVGLSMYSSSLSNLIDDMNFNYLDTSKYLNRYVAKHDTIFLSASLSGEAPPTLIRQAYLYFIVLEGYKSYPLWMINRVSSIDEYKKKVSDEKFTSLIKNKNEYIDSLGSKIRNLKDKRRQYNNYLLITQFLIIFYVLMLGIKTTSNFKNQ